MSNNEEDCVIFTADELHRYTSEALGEETMEGEEYVEEWLRWFRKRGERYLKDAASKGYYEVVLDLPFEIATRLDRPLFSLLMRRVQPLVPGCEVSIVEETYERGEEGGGETDIMFKLEISWL